jgi:hypothetical protein
MNTVTQTISLCAIAFLAGCATSYKSKGFGGGYSETQLAPDSFRVMFRGNAYTSPERMQDFALLRAADIVEQHGFTCFAVENERSSTAVEGDKTSGTSVTSGSVETSGSEAYMTGQSSRTRMQIYDFDNPQTGLLVRAFQTKPANVFTFEVSSLQRSIRQKYGIK